jgi:hypothetical protein
MSIPSIDTGRLEILKPVVIRSMFKKIHYASFCLSIVDIEARGFSRWISFVVASESETLVSRTISLNRNRIISIIEVLAAAALDLFRSEIGPFISYVEQWLNQNKENPNFASLSARKTELMEYRAAFGSSPPHSSSGQQTLEVLLNAMPLRKIEDLTKLHSVIPDLIQIIEGRSLNSPLKIIHGEFLFRDMLFSILAGRTLVFLCTGKNEVVISLLNAFTRLLPFRWNDDCRVFDEKKSAKSLLKYSLVLVPEIVGSSELLSVWNSNTNEYKGPTCPEKSFLMGLPNGTSETNGNEWEIKIKLFLEEMRDHFAKFVALHMSGVPRNEEEMVKLMNSNGLNEEDEEIWNYWIRALSNRSSRPVFMGGL